MVLIKGASVLQWVSDQVVKDGTPFNARRVYDSGL
mgnify:CR=1 FL=1